MRNYLTVLQNSAKMLAQSSYPVSRTTVRSLCAVAKTPTDYVFETLKLSVPYPFVVHVELNRPNRLNAFNSQMWTELRQCFQALHNDPNCRVIVLSGGLTKHFTAGIDLMDMMNLGMKLEGIEDVGRRARVIEGGLKLCQDSISSLELCCKPVIAAVHSACVGAGLDLITAADVRCCTKDAWFQVKEIDIGMAADVGTLQRLPKCIGNQSLARELCLTGRKVTSSEALNCGLVSRVFDTREDMITGAIELAVEIARKSPIAVQGIKKSLLYSLDHTNQEGLEHIRAINMVNLQSEDFFKAMMAQQSKGKMPIFAKL